MAAVLAQTGWMLTREARLHLHLFCAFLRAAHVYLKLRNCIGVRFGQGVESIPELQGVNGSIVFFWNRHSPQTVNQYYGPNLVNINLAKTIDKIPVKDLVFMQFLMVAESEAERIRIDVPNVPNLVDPGADRNDPMETVRPERPDALVPFPFPPADVPPRRNGGNLPRLCQLYWVRKTETLRAVHPRWVLAVSTAALLTDLHHFD